VVFLITPLIRPSKVCPDCKKKLPKYRMPNSLKQAAFGGMVCPYCGCEMNGKGKKIV